MRATDIRSSARPEEVDHLVHYMGIVVRAPDLTAWERKFCASIVAASRRAGWAPSGKQVGTMRRIVRDFQDSSFRIEE